MDLMISAFLAGIINLMLVLFVFFREETKQTKRIFLFLVISLSAWNFSSFGIYFATTDVTAIFWIRFYYLSLVFVPSVFFHFILTIIDDHRPINKRLRQIGYSVSYLFLLLSGIGVLSHDIQYLKGYYYPVASNADITFVIFFTFYGVYGIYLLAKRKIQTTNILERKQLTYLFIGSYIVLLGISANLLDLFGLNIYPFGHIATILYPLVASYAIVKHNLINVEMTGVELFARKTKFYLISAFIFIIFTSLIFGLERLIRFLIGYADFWTSALIITALCFILQPIRKGSQSLIDSRFFRKKSGQMKMLKEMLNRIEVAIDKEPLLDTMLNGIINIMYISNATVILLDEKLEEYEIAQAIGLDAIKKKTSRFSTKEGIIPYFENQINQTAFARTDITSSSNEIIRGIKRDFEKTDAEIFIPLRYKQSETTPPVLMGILSLGKKMSGENYGYNDLEIFSYLGERVGMNLKRINLYQEMIDYFINTIAILYIGIEKRNPFTKIHSETIGKYAELIASELGLSSSDIKNAKYAGLLHDIGYIGVCEQILLKREHITPIEFENIKSHVTIGLRILSSITNNQEILSGIKYHHERMDGSGYPESLEGKDIPLIARIIAVADVYNAMMSDRPYRRGFYREDVLAELKRHCINEFDSRVVGALERILNKEILRW